MPDLKILLIDDDAAFQREVWKFFHDDRPVIAGRRVSFTKMHSPSGGALESITDLDEFDIVITDIVGILGGEINFIDEIIDGLRKLRRSFSGSIIVLSGMSFGGLLASNTNDAKMREVFKGFSAMAKLGEAIIELLEQDDE